MKSSLFYSALGIVCLSSVFSTTALAEKTIKKNVKTAVVKTVSSNVSLESDQVKADLLQLLKEGNKRFVAGKSIHAHQDMETVKTLTKGQDPKCVIVSCSDSRVTPEIVFDQGLGDMFTIRTAGNVMNDYEEGSIEYAVEHLHTPLVIVMGHTGCGAIQAMLDNMDKEDDDDYVDKIADHVSKIVKKLKHEEEEQKVWKESGKNSDLAVVANVMNGVKQLRHSEPVLEESYNKKEINIVGAVYHMDSGEVEFLDF